MDKATAVDITGGLSNPSKMPGYAYGIPAVRCKVGSKLHEVPNSVCSSCYALKGMYVMPNVKVAQERRFQALSDPLWVDAMVYLILTVPQKHRGHFRWHDSGDLQDMDHLLKIVEVCEMTPEVQHYLPTRERGLVLSYVRQFGGFPPNLALRLSDPMVDGTHHEHSEHVLSSTVFRHKPPVGYKCPAKEKFGNTCGPCRACWDTSVPVIAYPWH
jgi:hypothetical protein